MTFKARNGRLWLPQFIVALCDGDLRINCRWCSLPMVPRGTGFMCGECDSLDRMESD